MKIPKKVLRSLLVLPDTFVGEVRFSSNGCGAFVLEIRHRERLTARTDELIDLTPDAHLGGALDLLGKPRR